MKFDTQTDKQICKINAVQHNSTNTLDRTATSWDHPRVDWVYRCLKSIN